jgi:hypothetical protein
MITRSRRAQLAAAGIITTLALAGCGSDDDSGSDTTAAAATTAADAATTTAGAETTAGGAETTAGGADTTAGGGAMTVEVNAVDYAFEDLPETVPVGTTLGLMNSSTTELHELVAFLLPADEERPVEDLMLLPEAELEAMFGTAEPATVIIAPPGEAGMPVVGDGSLTEPGRYAVICAIPIGADPAEYMAAAQSGEGPPQVEGGPPHFTAGMYGEITVE